MTWVECEVQMHGPLQKFNLAHSVICSFYLKIVFGSVEKIYKIFYIYSKLNENPIFLWSM
jgi:hypothetical protein